MFMDGFKRSLLKAGNRHKGGIRSYIINGHLSVMKFGITSKADDIRICNGFYRNTALNVNRVFNRKLFLTKCSRARAKYAMRKFLSDSEYRKALSNGRPIESRPVTAKDIIEFEENNRRRRLNKKRSKSARRSCET